MPLFQFHNQNVTASSTIRPLSDNAWQYRRLPFAALVEAAVIADEIGFLLTFYSGTDTLAEEQPLSAGGTDGVMPRFDQPQLEDLAAPFDELKMIIRETQATGTGDVMGWVRLTQLG